MGRFLMESLYICLLLAFLRCDANEQPMSGGSDIVGENTPQANTNVFEGGVDGDISRIGRADTKKSWDIRNLDLSSRFRSMPGSGTVWIGYFYEEIIVPALQNKNRLMVDCVVIEVRQEVHQRGALFDIGKLMVLMPLEFKDMVTLIGLCGELKAPSFAVPDGSAVNNAPVIERSPVFGQVILPGTLWCGLRDIAKNYRDLGTNFKLDSCCRDHDHCPVKLSSFESRYGITNLGMATRSHCMCDSIFYNCLKNVTDDAAETVGNLYFNLLRINCASEDKSVGNIPTVHMLYKCTQRDASNGCRMYMKKKNFQKKLKLSRFPNKF